MIELIEPNLIIETPRKMPVETVEQALCDVLYYFSCRECYDGKKTFSYDEIKYVINSKIKAIEQKRRSQL